VDKKQGLIWLGVVVRDHEGFVFAARSTPRNFFVLPVVAKASAALHTVELCREMSFNYIILERGCFIDCKRG